MTGCDLLISENVTEHVRCLCEMPLCRFSSGFTAEDAAVSFRPNCLEQRRVIGQFLPMFASQCPFVFDLLSGKYAFSMPGTVDNE